MVCRKNFILITDQSTFLNEVLSLSGSIARHGLKKNDRKDMVVEMRVHDCIFIDHFYTVKRPIVIGHKSIRKKFSTILHSQLNYHVYAVIPFNLVYWGSRIHR